MKEQDKNPTQPRPASNTTQPVMPTASDDNNQQTRQQQDEEQNEGDYVIVGSGLGIDE